MIHKRLCPFALRTGPPGGSRPLRLRLATVRCSGMAASTWVGCGRWGCNGIGKHLGQRLIADGETVLDRLAKLSARARVYSTGQGRKTDATDAHSVAIVALRAPDLVGVRPGDHLVALRMLADRRMLPAGRERGGSGSLPGRARGRSGMPTSPCPCSRTPGSWSPDSWQKGNRCRRTGRDRLTSNVTGDPTGECDCVKHGPV